MAKMVESGGKNAVGESSETSQVPPPTEQEKNILTHLNEIKSLQKGVALFEKIRDTTLDPPSQETFTRTIQTLRSSQEKLYNSLYVKFGIILEEADKIIAGADMPSKLRERVASTEQERVVAKLIELKNQENVIIKQLSNPSKPLTPEETRTLEKAYKQKQQEYADLFAQIAKRPDAKEIINMWEKVKENELKLSRAKEREKTPVRTK